VHRTTITAEQRLLTPRPLAAEVRRLTSAPAEWVAGVRLDPEGRWYEQIRVDDALELWLISWLPGQSTGFHDHGGANGAFGVVWGELDEYVAERGAVASAANPVPAGKVRSFGPRHVRAAALGHRVRRAAGRVLRRGVHLQPRGGRAAGPRPGRRHRRDQRLHRLAGGRAAAHPAERTVAIAPEASPAYWPF